jgi:hypothetical protein
MAGFIVVQPAQVMAGAPGVAMLGPNTRVKTVGGFVATVVDTVTLSNGGTGHWIAPDTRTQVGGVFTISQSSQGLAVVPGVPAPVAQLVVTGDPGARSQ